MSWSFDENLVIDTFADQLELMVGERLAKLKTPNGAATTTPAIYVSRDKGRQPSLPFISLELIPTSDQEGHTFDTGVTEIPDPDNVGQTIFVPYFDSAITFGLVLRCEGEESHSILREVRNKLKLERYRAELRDTVYTSIELINPIRSTPDLLANSYREVHTMLINMRSIDRLLDIETGYYDTVNWESTLATHADDDDPLVTTGSATSIQP